MPTGDIITSYWIFPFNIISTVTVMLNAIHIFGYYTSRFIHISQQMICNTFVYSLCNWPSKLPCFTADILELEKACTSQNMNHTFICCCFIPTIVVWPHEQNQQKHHPAFSVGTFFFSPPHPPPLCCLDPPQKITRAPQSFFPTNNRKAEKSPQGDFDSLAPL